MRDLGRRLRDLERREGEGWPAVLVLRAGDMTDAEVEAVVSERVRAKGWAGLVSEYPGRVVVLGVGFVKKSSLGYGDDA